LVAAPVGGKRHGTKAYGRALACFASAQTHGHELSCFALDVKSELVGEILIDFAGRE
jgi:hypothetical protein